MLVVLVVTKFDRFARTMIKSINEIYNLKERRIYFESLDFELKFISKESNLLIMCVFC